MRKLWLALALAGCGDQPGPPTTCLSFCLTVLVLYRDSTYVGTGDPPAGLIPQPPGHRKKPDIQTRR